MCVRVGDGGSKCAHQPSGTDIMLARVPSAGQRSEKAVPEGINVKQFA